MILNEKHELFESSFELEGSKYSAAFGNYKKDGESISREDYLAASEKFHNKSHQSGSSKNETSATPKIDLSLHDGPMNIQDYIDEMMEDDEEFGEALDEFYNDISKELGTDSIDNLVSFSTEDLKDFDAQIDEIQSFFKQDEENFVKDVNGDYSEETGVEGTLYQNNGIKYVIDDSAPGLTAYILSKEDFDKLSK